MRITITLSGPDLPRRTSMFDIRDARGLSPAVKRAIDNLRKERPDLSVFDVNVKLDVAKND